MRGKAVARSANRMNKSTEEWMETKLNEYISNLQFFEIFEKVIIGIFLRIPMVYLHILTVSHRFWGIVSNLFLDLRLDIATISVG